MVELSAASSQLALEQRSEGARLARERALWAVKPFGLLGIVLWILSPGTADVAPEQLNSYTLLAFLLGSTWGLLVFWPDLRRYLIFRLDGRREQKNRLPEEFYVGTVEEVRVEWNR